MQIPNKFCQNLSLANKINQWKQRIEISSHMRELVWIDNNNWQTESHTILNEKISQQNEFSALSQTIEGIETNSECYN